MSTRIGWQRTFTTTTTTCTPPEATQSTAVLQSLLENLSQIVYDRPNNAYPDLSKVIFHIRTIHQHLVAAIESSRVKEDFRLLSGFQALLETLRAYSGFYHPNQRTTADKLQLFELLEGILELLNHTFRGNYCNKRYFRQSVGGGGWAALEQAIASIGIGSSLSDMWSEARLFGKLVAFAIDEKRLDNLCHVAVNFQSTSVTKHSSTWSPQGGGLSSVAQTSLKDGPRTNTSVHEDPKLRELISKKLGDILGQNSLLCNAEVIPIIFDFWKTIPRRPNVAVHPAALVVVLALQQISAASTHNLMCLHSTGILSTLLPLAFDNDTVLHPSEQASLRDLCATLLSLGVNRLTDAHYLITRNSTIASDFVLKVLKIQSSPAYLQFDLSLHGYTSVELPSLIRSFPPPSTQPGYTFAAWICIDKFDPNAHTTLFGTFDSSQTCFVLAYVEKDTHNFILQTSITSAKPSVRFKMMAFNEHQWYHIAVVHRRPRTMTSSKATLYVDGEMVEQVKCQFPESPSISNSSTESFVSFTSSSTKHSPVQAFIGTPQGLSARLGRGVVFTRWSLASAHLFDDVLSDDLIAVYYRLGPRYNGNFQDCLGSFQTYEASAALGMRNELIHPGKDESSEILRAIRGKAGSLMAESRVLLSILPTAILGNHDLHKNQESQLLRGLSRTAANNLFQLTHNSGTSLVINAAVPHINEALTRTYGTSLLTGEPVLVIPQSLEDAMWRLGGFASVALKMVEQASTQEDIVRAVEILMESIKTNWRNSEAMERENGYAILGALLRGKIGAGLVLSSDASIQQTQSMSHEDRDRLGFQLLSLVLDFVGYKHSKPEDSFIVNPLAYRVLLVDFDMWRKTSLLTQRLYYNQFITFGVNSKYHQFNSRRLLRMRIVRRFLDALKAETFSRHIFPSVMEALESLVKCNLTAEVFRSLALYITYTYHTTSASASRTSTAPSGTTIGRSRTISSGLKRPIIEAVSEGRDFTSSEMTKRELGNGVLEMYTNLLCEQGNTSNIRKFARTVTNKWLLHLLTEDNAEVVVLGTKIIARLLVIHGSGYTTKFSTNKTGGYVIMRHRLRRWWDIPTLWPICFCILFARDVSEIDFEKPFELFSLLEMFDKSKIINPGILPVIMGMLHYGLKEVHRHQDDPESPLHERETFPKQDSSWMISNTTSRHRSMSLAKSLELCHSQQSKKERLTRQAIALHTVIRYLGDLHAKSADFRDYAANSEYVRLLLTILFPVIVNADSLSPEVELNSRELILNSEGDDVMIMPGTRALKPRVRTSSVETQLPPSPTAPKATPQRGSSFILLTSRPSEFSPSSARLNLVMSPKKQISTHLGSNAILEGFLELVVNVFLDQILHRKDFSGFGLFLKVPPGFREHHVYFESYLLRNTIQHLHNSVQLDQKSLLEPKLIQNISRFVTYMGEAIYEGWFLSGAEPLIDLAGYLLEYLQRSDISQMKSVRLCNQAIMSIRSVFLRVILLRFSELDSAQVSEEVVLAFMNKLLYWQTAILNSNHEEDNFLKLICYQLYIKLVDQRQKICLAAADLWRIMLVQKPEETSIILQHSVSGEHKHLSAGFKKLMELDNQTFFTWVDEHRDSLDFLFFGGMSRSWEEFVSVENERTEHTASNRLSKRREKLRCWYSEYLNDEDVLFRHELASGLWMKNIYSAEHLKHQRAQQDQQDNFGFLASAFSRMDRELHRPCAVFDDGSPVKWKLDRTEGRNRMRLRMLPDRAASNYNYQPKRKVNSAPTLKINSPFTPNHAGRSTPATIPSTPVGTGENEIPTVSADLGQVPSNSEESVTPEDDFELVDDPNDPGESEGGYEDKNRKVMRSLQRGDQVQQVFNISRIIGLNACEGLLILGKESLYLIDNVFQRSDGEIIDVSQAPKDERDPYLQMTSGQKGGNKKSQTERPDQESRSWKWNDLISISKRRFLFRDVAVEVFFTDGRSYLLTAMTPSVRDDLHAKLTTKAPFTSGSSALPNPEDRWRLEALKVADEAPITLGSKFGNIFNSSAWNPAMRKWAKGEISNFHYLMLINTMAGRTFNDMTQYPVFPWVLADYTSDELDLKDPATFRDLSKPMGAQNPAREDEFIERYKTFAEMSDGNTPAFHYGTHYSSAMIVTSYLIRLQPFVQSYLLLQGGNFDHPDRLFYSIEKAWTSASKNNMTDVRELIPEFFYLPEFLTNSNGYNFGQRQGNGGMIDTVVLPPWAKGDPTIFIAKHREALECPYVSQHLHHWIDLVFGCKQRGEAAINSVNVFHHLSYQGATDLDNIEDPVERLATIGIIHNFGQTPHQVFSKPHQAREDVRYKTSRLDTSAHAIARQPIKLFENHDRIMSLVYSSGLDRLLFAASFTVILPPYYDKRLEWGFADNSIRFFHIDTKKPAGLFENLHQGQLSTALFASSQLLITTGEDCVISAHTINTSPSKPVNLSTRTSLFGHHTPVTVIVVSRSFSTMLSASSDGCVILWDLNRLEFVRKLTSGRYVECAAINDATGDILICRGQTVSLYTLNAEKLLDQNICNNTEDTILSCAFYEGVGNEWLEHTLVFTGHRRGVVNIWRKAVGTGGKWGLELVKRLDHIDDRIVGGGATGVVGARNVDAGISCIKPMPKCVYTGDEDGRVYEWDIVQKTH